MRGRKWIAPAAAAGALLAVNAAAWSSSALCDFYAECVYPAWVNTYGRITGLLPFSVGEMMIVTGLILATAAIVLGFAAVIFFAFFRRKRFYRGFRRFCGGFYRAFAWTAVGVAAVMTLNCFILYHCSPFDELYELTEREEDRRLKENYSREELAALRDYVVGRVNELSPLVERDEEGKVIYSGDLEQTAIESMKALGEEYGRLSGYYPRPKPIHFSAFLSQQNMKGYFFPFSVEANYNQLMEPINKPATICHEYAHLKGFIYEEEANLIGFLACINSEDLTFRYSGYLSVLNYVNNEFYDSIGRDGKVYAQHVKISPQVQRDNVFLDEAAWGEVEEKAVVSTEVVSRVSGSLSQTSMVLNGVPDGILSYNRVVGLLLEYYGDDPELWPDGEEYLVQAEE